MGSSIQTARRRLIAVLAASAVVAFVAAGLNSGMLSLFPPGLKQSDLQTATAQVGVMVDEPASNPSIVRRVALDQDQETLIKHAELYGRVLASTPVLNRIAAIARVPADQLSGLARTTGNVPTALTEPDSERRVSDIRDSQLPYRLEVQARPGTPVIDVFTQAPTPGQATALADGAIVALRGYLASTADDQAYDAARVPQLRQLGSPRGGVVGSRMPLIIAVLTFGITFALTAGGLWFLIRRRQQRLGVVTPSATPQPVEETGGDWPRTTRVLPWMLAGFIALLWLTPFHQIELSMSMPIDMKLDRLVLPFVVALWVLALAAGGGSAPRIRPTWIHAAVGAFVVTRVPERRRRRAFAQPQPRARPVAEEAPAPDLVRLAVRDRGERGAAERGAAFLKLTLGSASWSRSASSSSTGSSSTVFWTFSEKLLPGGLFTLDGQLRGRRDRLHRPARRPRPAEEPLECVTMLSLALPIALVGLIQSPRWRNRVLYARGRVPPDRRHGRHLPEERRCSRRCSCVLTLAYFRRRELLKLAPLGLVMIIMITVLSPGVLGSVVNQFTRADAASVPTVSDRAADYDAVRPDVWTHLLFGRGWGSYNHVDYRILDSEILSRLIEDGRDRPRRVPAWWASR